MDFPGTAPDLECRNRYILTECAPRVQREVISPIFSLFVRWQLSRRPAWRSSPAASGCRRAATPQSPSFFRKPIHLVVTIVRTGNPVRVDKEKRHTVIGHANAETWRASRECEEGLSNNAFFVWFYVFQNLGE